MGCPEIPIGVDDGRNRRLVNGLEQTPAEDLDRLILLGGVQQRRLSCRNALRFCHLVGDELVLFGVGVGGHAVLSDRQGVDQNRVGRAFDGLEQRGQERRHLIACILETADLAQVDRQLVEQNQRRLAAEQPAQGLSAGSDAGLVAPAHPLVARSSGQLVGDLSPWGVGENAVSHLPPVGRIGVLAIIRRDAHGSVR